MWLFIIAFLIIFLILKNTKVFGEMNLGYLINDVYNGNFGEMFTDMLFNSIALPKLHMAVNMGDFRTVRKMIQDGADVNDQEPKLGFTPLFGAVITSNVRMLELLIRSGANVNIVTKDQRTPLTAALVVENVDIIRTLLENGADINIKILKHQSVLHMAVQSDNIQIVRLFIKHGLDVNVRNASRETPLHYAVHTDKIQFVELLLSKGADVNALSLNPWEPEEEEFKMGSDISPLFLAVLYGKIEIANILIKADANVNTKTSRKFTPLHVAVKNGQLALVRMLIEAGSDVNVQLDSGEAPLLVALEKNHYEIAQLLVKHNAAVDFRRRVEDTTPLFLAVEKENENLVKLLIEKGADVNAANKFGVLPIHVAACSKSVEIVKLLLSNGSYYCVEVQAKSHTGSPAELARKRGSKKSVAILALIGKLFNAVMNNDIDKLEYCIQEGAIINARNISGRTALHYAVSNSNVKAVNILIASNADTCYATNKGNLPLHIAVSNENQEIIEILLEHAKKLLASKRNLIVNAITTENGNAALHVAAKKNNFQVAKLLIANGAICNVENKFNKRPVQLTKDEAIQSLLILAEELFETVKKEDSLFEVTQIPEDDDSMINARDADGGGTLLYWSVSKGRLDIVNKLLSMGADYCLVTNKGTTPLHIAASKGNVEIVKALVGKVNDSAKKVEDFINATTANGTAALHVVSNVEVVKCLLQAGAMYNIRNGKGKRAVELSQNEGVRKFLSMTHQIFEDVKKGVPTVVSSWSNLKKDEFKAVTGARNEDGQTLLDIAHGTIAGKLREKLKKGK